MPLIRSGGVLTTISAGPERLWPWPGPAGGWLEGVDGHQVGYDELLKQHSVRTVLGFLARNIASLTPHPFRRMPDGKGRERLPETHVLVRSLRRPMPRVSPFRWWESIVFDLLVWDRALVFPEPGEGGTWVLRRIPPAAFTVKTDDIGEPQHVIITSVGEPQVVPLDEVVLFDGYRPWVLPAPPMEALRTMVLESAEAAEYRLQVWRRAGRFGTLVKRPADAPAWSDSALDRFRNGFVDAFRGDGPNAGGVAVLEDGMSVEAPPQPVTIGDGTTWRQLTLREVCQVYGVPPAAIGLTDGVGVSATREARKSLYQDTFAPYLELLGQTLEAQLFPILKVGDDTYIDWGLAKKLEADFLEQAAVMSASTGAPWVTRNEARARLNLPPVVDGDELVVPLNVLVGGLASPRDTAPDLEERIVNRQAPVVDPASTPVPKAKASRVSRQRMARRQWTKKAETVLGSWVERHRKAAEKSPNWAKARSELEALLLGLGFDAAQAGALAVAEDLDVPDLVEKIDGGLPLGSIRRQAKGRADALTRRVRSLVADAAEDGDEDEERADPWDVARNDVQSSGSGWVALAVSAGILWAGKRSGAGGKTWHVNSGNPRSTHAMNDGVRVELDQPFPNGQEFPGQYTPGDPGEVANCQCEMEVSW